MTVLLVGFDSAWTPNNFGALVGVMRTDDGRLHELGIPMVVRFSEAEHVVREWQAKWKPTSTIHLLDQPTIVNNATGQRPVENIVSCAVSRRYGGMQPANTLRKEMFGINAPVWNYLDQFGGVAHPLNLCEKSGVIETYPVLTMIALGWLRSDELRVCGRLPKYNPARKKTFSVEDWKHVCTAAAKEFSDRGLAGIAQYIRDASGITKPRKRDQDCLDACICIIVALHLAEGRKCMMVGDMQTGYILVPDSETLRIELADRCRQTGRDPAEWVRTVQW